MKCAIAGKLKCEFTKDNGDLVSGTSVYLGEPMRNINGEGLVVSKAWVPNSVMPYKDIKVGECDVEFNSAGKIISLNF